jgi:hypothetical protein
MDETQGNSKNKVKGCVIEKVLKVFRVSRCEKSGSLSVAASLRVPPRPCSRTTSSGPSSRGQKGVVTARTGSSGYLTLFCHVSPFFGRSLRIPGKHTQIDDASVL